VDEQLAWMDWREGQQGPYSERLGGSLSMAMSLLLGLVRRSCLHGGEAMVGVVTNMWVSWASWVWRGNGRSSNEHVGELGELGDQLAQSIELGVELDHHDEGTVGIG
jgi:hypothetical protein